MNLQIQSVWQVINACLPVFVLILVGWLSVDKKIVGKDAKKICSTLVSNFVFPALLFTETAKAKPTDIFNGVWMLGFFCAMAGIWLISFVANRYVLGLCIKQSAMRAMLCSFPNMGGMGVPFLTLLIGSSATISVAVANFVVAISLIPLTIFLLELGNAVFAGEQLGLSLLFKALKNSLCKPMFIAVLLGSLVSLSHGLVYLPKFVFHTMDIVAQSCNFVSLFAVGVAVYGTKITLTRSLSYNLLIKCLITPVIAWSMIVCFHLTGAKAEELIFLLAMPTATTATILAYQWQVAEEDASSIYMASTLLSIITLPILLLLMQAYIPGVV